jgi:1-deoxy-D-xylulose-5-phosphate reductoisomerase
LSSKCKRIAVLGSTGSVGRQTLDIVGSFPNLLKVVVLSGFDEVDVMYEQAIAFQPEIVVMVEKSAGLALQEKLCEVKIEVIFGQDGLKRALNDYQFDLLLNAIVGAAGMMSTYQAVAAGCNVALANKESLVVGGSLIMPLAKANRCAILPVDSEHSAIFQCMQRSGEVDRILLTASGGPFWQKSREEIAQIKPAEALRHPNWKMGPKITIDSASFMNKGLEIIEAHWLFGVPYEKISALVHPESIIHSMVEYSDGSVIAQLALPDMRLPIAYALFYPEAVELKFPRLDLCQIGSLHFDIVDEFKFPCFALALQAGKQGGSMPAVLNGANEIAVNAFLRGAISFYDIPQVVERTMDASKFPLPGNIEGFLEIDAWARRSADAIIARL